MKFTVPSSQQTPTLLRDFLRSQGLSLTQWRKAKTAGTLFVNNHPANPSCLVSPGDQITIGLHTESKITPADIPISIAYEDDHLLIVDKPAGLLIHPASTTPTHSLANAVINYYVQNNWDFSFHPVLRLDRNTSGLVLIAKLPYIQHLLSKQPGIVSKQYLALVCGHPEPPEGLIDAPIARHPSSIIERIVDSNGQPAQTKYRICETYPHASLAQIELLTGRTHQIRVHFSHIGHPLLGDDLYGGPQDLLTRQALHAAHLHFLHPVSGLPVAVSSLLPNDMKQAITHLKQRQSGNSL